MKQVIDIVKYIKSLEKKGWSKKSLYSLLHTTSSTLNTLLRTGECSFVVYKGIRQRLKTYQLQLANCREVPDEEALEWCKKELKFYSGKNQDDLRNQRLVIHYQDLVDAFGRKIARSKRRSFG